MAIYNGVSLPALPAYDTSAFPYAYISKNTAGTAYILTVSEERPVYGTNPEASTVTGVYHYGLSGSYLVDDGAWVLQVEAEGFVCTADGVGSVIWTNTDILKSDGSVYLAASEPVSTADWRKSFLMGLALGLCGKPLPYKQKEPVAYLYNGVRLPKLPEWDKSVYPYAYIYKGSLMSGGISYHLHLTSELYYATSTSGNWCVGRRAGDISYWWYEGLSESFVYQREWTNEGVMAEMYNLVWADFDVLDVDGTVALAASDPVPVYE